MSNSSDPMDCSLPGSSVHGICQARVLEWVAIAFSHLLQEGLCHTQGCCTQSPWPCGSPLLTRTSAGNSQTLRGRSGSVSVGSPGAHKALSEPSERLWWVWGSILNAVSPLLLSCWCLSFALGCGISFFGGIQHSPLDGCSVGSCNFGVLNRIR